MAVSYGRFIAKHKIEGKRLTRKLTALRQEAWRFMHATLATQHKWCAAVLSGHHAYYGRPHNYPALNGFYREVRRTWLRCLRRRNQKSRRMAWLEFETLTARFRLPTPCITRIWAHADMTRVTLGKGRVRESRPPGSVRAKPNGRATRPRSQTRIRAKISQRIPQRITSRIDLTMPLCASILPLACKWPRFTAVPKGGAHGGWTGRA
jgi:hypothetical protein